MSLTSEPLVTLRTALILGGTAFLAFSGAPPAFRKLTLPVCIVPA